MTTFGDFDPDDAFDPTQPADPEQVAIKLHELRRDRAFESQRWDQLSANQRAPRIEIVAALLAWLRRSGAT
jgi:hypothetical protein